ncbi:MAG: cell division protein FtsK [Oscillospiraceae bacterium]|nr:cell division protein FtsK [Oscillospiraceae bacterium]
MAENERKMVCTLGKFDIPIIQRQPLFQINLLDSNVIVLGSSMSGKTTLLRTLINILHKQYTVEQEQIFILDFGGALASYKDFPLVAAYFDNSNEEYVKRVFKILESILKSNIQALNGTNYPESEKELTHTTFVVDNLNAFLDEPRYTTYQEKLAKLCRDGLSKGITLVVTASDNKGLNSYMSAFKQKIVFDMPHDKYLEIFNEKVGVIGNGPGHGYANVTVKIPNTPGSFRQNLPYEFQCCTPYFDEKRDMVRPENANTEEDFREKINTKFGFDSTELVFRKCVKKYRTFPKELTRKDYEKLLEQGGESAKLKPGEISVGLDYVEFMPAAFDLSKSYFIGIYGKRGFGKTNLLRLILNGSAEVIPKLRLVLVDDGRKQVTEEHLQLHSNPAEMVIFSENVETEWIPKDGMARKVKRTPIQQLYAYMHENYLGWEKSAVSGCYGIAGSGMGMSKEISLIPDCSGEKQPPTIFVIQSKLLYSPTRENRYFLEYALQQFNNVAEEQHIAFIFSDIQKFSEADRTQLLNDKLMLAFLLDNIAEFVSDRGQKSVFGNMDVKELKEDYARCEPGDGYFYDVTADELKKIKFIKENET